MQRFLQIHHAETIFAKRDTASKRRTWFRKIANEMIAHYQDNHPDDESITAWKEEISALVEEVSYYETQDDFQFLRSQINTYLAKIRDHIAGVTEYDRVELDLPHALVGNEFTFTSHGFGTIAKRNYKSDDARSKEMLAEYEKNLKNWTEKMTGYNIPHEDRPGKYGNPGARFTLNLGTGSWYYDVTMDDLCVEVITPPVPAHELVEGEVAIAIDKYIFGVARSLDLRADAVIGGGHINIDRGSGVENQRGDLLDFLKAFYDDQAYWMNLDEDAANAAFPSESMGDAVTEFQQIYERYSSASEEERPSNDELAAEMVSTVLSHKHSDLPSTVKAEDYSHYQAVNLDHYSAENPGEQRVEVRRVPAQENRKQLLNQLDRLFHLMTKQAPPEAERF